MTRSSTFPGYVLFLLAHFIYLSIQSTECDIHTPCRQILVYSSIVWQKNVVPCFGGKSLHLSDFCDDLGFLIFADTEFTQILMIFCHYFEGRSF